MREGRGTWLAISSIDRANNKEGWWCFPPEAVVGDLVFIYQKRKGVYRLERIISQPKYKEQACATRGLLTADTLLIREFVIPVNFRKIKGDPVLSKIKGVSRRLQGTTFEVNDEQRERLIKLLSEDNPSTIRFE